MSKSNELVFAAFMRPTECRECPCAHITYRYSADVCQLLNKPINSLTSNSPIPEWCPLTSNIFNKDYAK
jgi:hypothetical protein